MTSPRFPWLELTVCMILAAAIVAGFIIVLVVHPAGPGAFIH